MRRAPILLIPLLILVASVAAVSPASASTPGSTTAARQPTVEAAAQPAGTTGQLATYQGRIIDLSKSWQGAKVCSWYSSDDVRCHATREEAAAEDLLAAGRAVIDGVVPLAASDCTSGWFCLFSGTGFTGNMVRFRDAGPCQALAPWGFNNVASSWVNRLSRVVTIADGSTCNGTSLIVPPTAQGSSMGTMDNRASSIRIN